VLKCLEKDSTFVPGLELLAEVYMIQYKPKDAASVYEQIIKLKPEKYYMLTLARLYEYSNHQKAIKIYEEILNSGDDINILTRLAAIYEDNKNDEEYDKAIDRIYKAFPDNPRTLLPVMESYLKRKKFGTALSVLYKVQQTVLESDLDIYFNIAGEYLLEDTSSATTSIYIPKYLSYVDNRFYFSWRMQLLSGLLQMKLKDTVKAEKTLLHCLDISDTMPDVVLEVVLFYTRSKDYIKSNKMINDYRTQFPNDWRFPFYQGFNFYNLNDDMNAIKAYNQSIALDPTRVDTYVQLGMSFDRLKLYDSTLAVYDRALKLKPDDPTLNNNYAYTLSELGKNLDLAIDMIKIALSADSSNISFLDTYAWIQFKLGNYGQALEYIQKAINTGSVHAEVYEHLGDIYMKMDKKNEAIEAWREGLKIESNNQPLLERLEKVK
jgi:tetratricopeptide (TPR) repeat protein